MRGMRLVPKLGHRTAEQMRSCFTTASTDRWSVHLRANGPSCTAEQMRSHCTVELRRRSMRAFHSQTRTALDRQMLSNHLRAQLIALAGRHHRSFGHDDIFLSQSGGEMESLFHQ